MLRFLSICLLVGGPASAWEAGFDGLCTLSHEEVSGEVLVTYDPARALYAITVTRASDAWRGGPVYGIRFSGPFGLTITTDRHRVAGLDVTVVDTGFGNVLNGLARNETATALLGDQAMTVSLDGAAEAVEAFRACALSPRLV